MLDPQFTKSERADDHAARRRPDRWRTTSSSRARSRGLGYKVEVLDVPDNDALQLGKEFGNRGQCNPTYFTVGNLVKYLIDAARRAGHDAPRRSSSNYVFLTAGACGPCRFGMYVTEYRKALRDAGFDGFRVMLFQQTGRPQAGDRRRASGLEMNPTFFIGHAQGASSPATCSTRIGYRIRPYEVEPGATDQALEEAKKIVYDALDEQDEHPAWRCCKCAARCSRRSRSTGPRPSPRSSIIGEFWAMTTEGDGNYELQRFLEAEGAECDIQLVTAWLLYMLWEVPLRHQAARATCAARTAAQVRPRRRGESASRKKLATLWAADMAAARALPDLRARRRPLRLPPARHGRGRRDRRTSYYNNDLRGGEGHMEVGKLILNVVHDEGAHDAVSVKPFGCMPSLGRLRRRAVAHHREATRGTIFCAIETSGDGAVTSTRRVQMYLFKARLAAQKEYAELLAKLGRHRRAGAATSSPSTRASPARCTARRTPPPAPPPIAWPRWRRCWASRLACACRGARLAAAPSGRRQGLARLAGQTRRKMRQSARPSCSRRRARSGSRPSPSSSTA